MKKNEKKKEEVKQGKIAKFMLSCLMIAATCFYLSSLLSIVQNDKDDAATYMCLGSVFLYLGVTINVSNKNN